MRSLVAQGKPVAATEFGAATFRGAGELGAQAPDIVEYGEDGPVRPKGEYVRDEAGQATCVRELLEIVAGGGVDSVAAFTAVAEPYREQAAPARGLRS